MVNWCLVVAENNLNIYEQVTGNIKTVLPFWVKVEFINLVKIFSVLIYDSCHLMSKFS